MRYCFWLMCVLCSADLFAQSGDTTFLPAVEVYGMPVTEYAIGSKVKEIKTGDNVTMLSSALSGLSSIYLKNYGNGQLSTVGLRGTSASQTAVLWNGININSPSLGLTDLSLIPMFFSDDIAVQYGTSSALYGSDAIGGTIVLGNAKADFKNRFSVLLHQAVGSFGHRTTGGKFKYGNSKIQATTAAYSMRIENNFPFHSPAVGFEKIQNHAGVENYGFNQRVAFRLNADQALLLEGMYTHNRRDIQPTVTNNDANEELLDKNIRTSATYKAAFSNIDLAATAAWMSNLEKYYDDYEERNQVDQFSAVVNLNHYVTSRTSLRYGIASNLYRASSDHYAGAREQRHEMFASIRSAFNNWLNYNINLRQVLVDGTFIPFTPAIGAEAILIRNEKRKFSLNVQAGRGYRLPTLNDRFWVPGGNPSLEPEDAFQVESGFTFSQSQEGFGNSISVSGYRSWIEDMIIWKNHNSGVWSPVNLQDVQVTGLEVETSTNIDLAKHQLKADLSYAITESLNKKAMHESDLSTVNKQVPYVPKHAATARFSISIHRLFDFNTSIDYTSQRYSNLSNDDHTALDPFTLWNVSLSKKVVFTHISAALSLSLNNINDVYYENLEHHAMPGRNYLATITFNYNR